METCETETVSGSAIYRTHVLIDTRVTIHPRTLCFISTGRKRRRRLSISL